MNGVSSVTSSSNYYSSIASGVSLQSAADGAAELAISEAAEVQVNSYDVGSSNVESAVSVLNIEDAALETVSSMRSETGATTNSMSHISAYNSMASYNQSRVLSQLQDTDYSEAVSEMKKQAVLDTYKLMMQKKQQEDEKEKANIVFQ